MNQRHILITLALAAALTGCGKQETRHIIVMPDVSGSIERESLEQAFTSIEEFAGHLNRGDRLTIIPILGDAQADSSGQIIRFEIPKNRQAYDSDLKGFKEKLRKSLEALRLNAVTHPGAKTDILGSISLAYEDFQSHGSSSINSMLILSDFIEEDPELDFRRSERVENAQSAAQFAVQVAAGDSFNFTNVSIYLGLLRSREYSALSRRRRMGIETFWINYFKAIGGRANFATDGPSLLK